MRVGERDRANNVEFGYTPGGSTASRPTYRAVLLPPRRH
jgi:hypothetical protein